MKYSFILILFCSLFSFSCSGQNHDSVQIHITRFDTEMYKYLNEKGTEGIPQDNNRILSAYPLFLNLYGHQVISIGGTDSIGFFDRLNTFFSEPTLMSLYKDEQTTFAGIDAIESELSTGFTTLFSEFSNLKKPEIYMHVSGLNQNIVVTDEFLSVSADKYLGADYPLYQQFFYDYERQQMTPDRIVPDYLLGFLMANFPFKGNEDVLLDRMLYEGKLRYILTRLLPERQVWEYVGYTKEQYLWCSNNQSRIWKSILENQHLFNADYLVTSKYLKDAPHTAFLPSESPGRAGIWVGYQIVISYMKNHSSTTLEELMNMVDYPKLLKDAKYKP